MTKEKEQQLIEIKKEYEALKEMHSLPDFKTLDDDFEIERMLLREEIVRIKIIRISISDKIYAILRIIETLINPTSAPSYLLQILKNTTEEDSKRFKKMYEDLYKIQMRSLKLDSIYNEKEEIKFINEITEKYQTIKKEVYQILESLESKTKESQESKKGNYFG